MTKGSERSHTQATEGTGMDSLSSSTDLGVWPPALQGEGKAGLRSLPLASAWLLPPIFFLLTFVLHCPAQPPACAASHLPQAHSSPRHTPVCGLVLRNHLCPLPWAAPLGPGCLPHPQTCKGPLQEPQIRLEHSPTCPPFLGLGLHSEVLCP